MKPVRKVNVLNHVLDPETKKSLKEISYTGSFHGWGLDYVEHTDGNPCTQFTAAIVENAAGEVELVPPCLIQFKAEEPLRRGPITLETKPWPEFANTVDLLKHRVNLLLEETFPEWDQLFIGPWTTRNSKKG